MPSALITQRSRVQIPPPLPGNAGQGPDCQTVIGSLDLLSAVLSAGSGRVGRQEARGIGISRHSGWARSARRGLAEQPRLRLPAGEAAASDHALAERTLRMGDQSAL